MSFLRQKSKNKLPQAVSTINQGRRKIFSRKRAFFRDKIIFFSYFIEARDIFLVF